MPSDSEEDSPEVLAAGHLRPASRRRLERLAAGITLQLLSVTSGVSSSALSLDERGLQPLSWRQEQARREALERLKRRAR